MTAPSLSDDRSADPAPPTRTGLRAVLGGTLGLALWSLLVLALLVTAAVFGLQWFRAEQRADVRADALQAARQEALNLTSVDGTDVKADLDRVLEGASGQFRQEFEAQAARLSTVLEENQVRAEGNVLDAGLTRADGDSATALVVIDSVVRNKAIPDGQTRTYRMQLELERVGSRWLTNRLEFVS
ncbi:MAG: hypothetical protein JWO60_2838 [Frankiales bacterium]|nr:hypothetical protein [Frankiales bacterium]